MNELRGRLDNIIWDNLEAIDTDYGHPIVKGHDKALDAILDAVIAALPETYRMDYQYKEAIHDTKAILEKAKVKE